MSFNRQITAIASGLLVIGAVSALTGCNKTAPPTVATASKKLAVDAWSIQAFAKDVNSQGAVLANNRVGVRIFPTKSFGSIEYSTGEFDNQGEEKIQFKKIDQQVERFFADSGIDLYSLNLKEGRIMGTAPSDSRTNWQAFLLPHQPVLVQAFSSGTPGVTPNYTMTGEPTAKTAKSITFRRDKATVTIFCESGLEAAPEMGGPRYVCKPMVDPSGIKRLVVVWNFDAAAATSAMPGTLNELKGQLASASEELWKSDIVIDGPPEDQQAVRSFLFNLKSAFSQAKGDVVAPFGLTNSLYFGHKFWDMDVWIAPALALIDPGVQGAAAEYRFSRMKGANENFVRWASEPGRKVAPDAVSTKFPWESSVSGKETVPGSSRDQDHISMSVLWGADLAAGLGTFDSAKLAKMQQGVESFVKKRVTKTARGIEFLRTMSPDENHIGNNDLYTNILAQWTLNNRTYKTDKGELVLPRAGRGFLTYDDDKMRGYKQAAAILAIFPLQYPPAEADSREMMSRFAGKATQNGPAMTESIEATIWARMGELQRGYETWKLGWEPFVKDPFLSFSEKRRQPRTYFYTGAAGALSTVIFGFIGARIDSTVQPRAAWSKPLKNGKFLSIKPNLPFEWKGVTFKGMRVLGESYDMVIARRGDKVVTKVTASK